MININQTSENSKIYIQRNITNDEPVINNYVTEDELQEILKEYNNVPYLFIRNDGAIISGDFDAVYDAVKNKKPYLIYVYSFSNNTLLYSPAECVSLVNENGIRCTYDLTYIIDGETRVLYRYIDIYKTGAIVGIDEERIIPTEFKTINGNEITGEGDIKIDVDLDGYATEQWVDDKGYLKEIPEEYVTDIELANKNYVDTSYLNTELEGYAKQSYVDDAIANVGNGNIVELTQEEYNNTTPEPDTLYVISDAPAVEIPDTSNFVDKETLTYEIDAINNSLSQKQDTLVSGQNIKTINNQSIVGSGNITIEGGSGNIVELTQSEYNAIIPDSDTLYLISDSSINTTLKTINGESIIGEGDIKVEASVDLTGYATEQWVEDKGYAKLSYVDEQIGNINNVLENIIG